MTERIQMDPDTNPKITEFMDAFAQLVTDKLGSNADILIVINMEKVTHVTCNTCTVCMAERLITFILDKNIQHGNPLEVIKQHLNKEMKH